MAWKPAWLAIALVVPCACSVEELDRPQPQSDPPKPVITGGGVFGGGAGGDGGAGTTTSSAGGAGGAGGNMSTGAGFVFYEFCGCMEAFLEGSVPACQSCVETSKTDLCATQWAECQASQLCLDIIANLATCSSPYDPMCVDVAVFMKGGGIGSALDFFACACQSACAGDCPPVACQ